MKRVVTYCFLAITFCFSFLPSCMNDIDLLNVSSDIQWSGSLAIPIGEANLSMEELVHQLDSQNILVTEGQEILYRQVDSIESGFREIDLLEYSQPLSMSIPVSPMGTQTIPANSSFSVTSNGTIDLGLNRSPEEIVDSIQIKSATLTIKVNVANIVSLSPDSTRITLEFSPERVRKSDGSPLSIVYVPAGFNQAASIPIQDVAINTAHASGIPVAVKVELKAGNSPVTVRPSSMVNVELKFTQLQFKVAYGKFEPAEIATTTFKLNLDLPSFTWDGNFKFADPRCDLTVKSNIGTYMLLDVAYVKAYSESNPEQAIYASFNGNHFTTEALNDKPGRPGLWVAKQLRQINKEYGAIDQFFDHPTLPDVIEFKYTVRLDEDKINRDPTPNFITPDAGIKVIYKIQIPLYLKPESYYELNDTIKDVGDDIDDALEDASIDNAKLILTVSNGLPIKGDLSIILLDSLNREITSDLDTDYPIDAPAIDAGGYVTQGGVTPQKIEIELTNSQIEDLKKANHIAYRFRIDSKDDRSFIHFTTSNYFGVKLGMFVRGSVKNTDSNKN
jgi:hypothetical protein